MSRRIHVLQGFSAAGCFAQAIHPEPEDVLVNDDVLSCGPLPIFRSVEQWTNLRGTYWNTVLPGEFPPPSEFNRDFLKTLLGLQGADSIVVWIGIGLAEQLMLAWIVHLLRFSGSQAQISVVQFTRVGKRNIDVWGLGLLNPDQIREHPPIEPLTADARTELDHYWVAVSSADPAQLLSVLSNAPTCVPHFRSSLEQIIRRYPDHQTGLGRWDFELLKYAKERGPKVTRVIGETMGLNFDADLASDAYLFWRLRGLAASDLAHPLVALSGDPYDMRDCQVTLTEEGELVLAGRANAIELNGIDDWVLGVHLDSRQGSSWYRKGSTLVSA
jgi:hypothetical protein